MPQVRSKGGAKRYELREGGIAAPAEPVIDQRAPNVVPDQLRNLRSKVGVSFAGHAFLVLRALSPAYPHGLVKFTHRSPRDKGKCGTTTRSVCYGGLQYVKGACYDV